MSIRKFAARVFRRFFPRREHPLLDAADVRVPRDASFESAYARSLAEEFADGAEPFVAQRYREGMRWRSVVAHFARGRVLDVGGGNGAIELAFAASERFTPFSVEYLWNAAAARVHQYAATPFRRSLADAATLPFHDRSFDVVLFLETLEHVRNPHAVGAEIARVLRDDGIVLITTPPRWRYAFKPDPHFGVRGLVLLPPALQRSVAARRGYDGPEHFVDRIYSSVKQIERCFPDCDVVEVLSRSRAPQIWFWDAIVLRRRKR
jgi:SAM-dependent methyltransferase